MKKTINLPGMMPAKLTLDVFVRKGMPCVVLTAPGGVQFTISGASVSQLAELEDLFLTQAQALLTVANLLGTVKKEAENT